MAQEEALTESQARELIRQIFGQNVQMRVSTFEFGWLAQAILSEEDRRRGRHIGLGNFIIDRTGVVTAHSSLSPLMVIEEYSKARRQGRTHGRQVRPRVEAPPAKFRYHALFEPEARHPTGLTAVRSWTGPMQALIADLTDRQWRYAPEMASAWISGEQAGRVAPVDRSMAERIARDYLDPLPTEEDLLRMCEENAGRSDQ